MKTGVRAQVKTRVCSTCGEEKPLDEDNWRRDKYARLGWSVKCKTCQVKNIKARYRHFTKKDVEERGEFGVYCVLWAESVCGVCPCTPDDLTKCWRLTEEESDPDNEGYPDILPQ